MAVLWCGEQDFQGWYGVVGETGAGPQAAIAAIDTPDDKPQSPAVLADVFHCAGSGVLSLGAPPLESESTRTGGEHKPKHIHTSTHTTVHRCHCCCCCCRCRCRWAASTAMYGTYMMPGAPLRGPDDASLLQHQTTTLAAYSHQLQRSRTVVLAKEPLFPSCPLRHLAFEHIAPQPDQLSPA